MFILHNLKRSEPLSIKKINNRHKLILDTPTYQQYAFEKPTQDNLIVCESDDTDCISNIRNIQLAGYFEFQTILKDPTPIEVKHMSYQDLLLYHGSKMSKKVAKTTNQIESQLNIDRISLSHNITEEQILPKFNEDTTDVSKVYKLSIMFDPYLLQRIKEYDLTVQNLKTENFKYNPKKKSIFIILDTILYVLKKNHIPDRLPHDEISYDILSHILSQNTHEKLLEYNKIKNYNQVEKMKLIAMCYIMILKIKDNKVNLLEVPKFHLTDPEIEKVLKVLGCKIEKQTGILSRIPNRTTNIRRR